MKLPSRRLAGLLLALSIPAVLVLCPSHSVAGKEPPRDPRKDHWAFQPISRSAPPEVALSSWPRNPVDRFILARLEQAGLAPSPETDRPTLLRRLKFDLLGLPPAPEEVVAFAADPDPLAYERLVDKYLASPAYGERWARHWLDAVRFAESDGFETNPMRPNAWPYRDYVIRAFNADTPYDRFVQEQLAGDLLGADAATGFLVGGAFDRVKSPDVVLTLQQRADELHDMVSTTSSTFLGLTAGCARCHNHKFDPIAQLDYYRLKAVFAGVQHGERPCRLPGQDARPRQIEEWRGRLAALETSLARLEPLAQPGAEHPLRAPVNPLHNVERFAAVAARFVRLTVLQTNQSEPCIDELEVYTAEDNPRNVALAGHGTRATASGTLPGYAIHKLEHINDGRYGNGRSWISSEPGKGWVQLEFPRTEKIDRIVWGRDREGRFGDRVPTKYRFEVAVEPGEWKVVASSDDRLPPGSTAPLPGAGLKPDERAELADLTRQRQRLEELVREATSPRPVYAGRFTTPETVHLLARGDPLNKRQVVAPGGVARFGPELDLPPETEEAQRRLALAKWITDPRQPLSARVLVNRLWQHHFGTGLVATPSDFGRNGARPSHPELLDWLASEFVAGGWRIKPMQRLLVLSSTYRQASAANPKGLETDAGDRLLWRYPPRRLEAEALRDAILFVSGKLDRRMGGPGFELFEARGNTVQGVKVYVPKTEFGPAEWRRLIYQSKPRMQLDDTFGAFDCPDGGQIAPRRTTSTTPLQALNLLHGRFVVQQAEFFARRVETEAGAESAAQVRRAFALAFQRDATADELGAALPLVREHGLAALCRALLNANEFLYVF
jgi:hypothetical protein